MPTTRDLIRRVAVLATLFTVALGLAGCALVVEEPAQSGAPGTPNPVSTLATELPLYDVSVSAIDFDPPLKRETLVGYDKPIKLLAAVENKGTMPLTSLSVEARISSQRGDFTAQDQVHLEKIAPGETRVVEFVGMVPTTSIPKSPSYRIRVIVDGRQLGPNIRGNVREVIVRVVDAPLPE